jgi:uracil-DNA glycosylase family 4
LPEVSVRTEADPPRDCGLCPRLYEFLKEWRQREPAWHNSPVATFVPRAGDDTVRVLVVGLAPGLRGANRTGRPFTGDHAGMLLYATLARFGMARGDYDARPDDGLELIGTAITNAVRCVPPENRPTGAEVATCRGFLGATIDRFPNLKAIVTLGTVAHQSVVRALGRHVSELPFAHGAELDAGRYTLFASYHCSRYNTNTGRLTEAMFVDVFRNVWKAAHGA